MDIDSIPFGIDFRDHIRNALFDSDVMVAIVGPRWLGPGKGSHLRIKEENDPIRIEVETALERGIAVIPVLVSGAAMPKPSDLPVSLENFAFRNAAEVDSGRDFHPHMDRLIRSIGHILQAKGKLPVGMSREPSPAETTHAAPGHEPSPAPQTIAAAAAGPPGATEPPAPPAAKAKRSGANTAIAAAAGAAFTAVIAGIAIWFFSRPAPIPPSPQVIAEPRPAPQPIPGPQPPAAREPVVAAGCPGTPAFHDNFKTADPGWDLSDNTSISDGQLVIKAKPNTYSRTLYRSLIYKNATICLDVKTPTDMDNTDYGGGLLFWAADYLNFYLVKITVDGRYRISRKSHDTWWTIVPLTKFEALKQGYGVVNRIKVTTAGNVATVYLNDRKAHDIKGQPPKSGGSVGIYGDSEPEHSNEWRFLDIAVVELPAGQTITVPPSEAATKALLAACKLGPSAAFADDFKVSDPSWSGLDGNIVYYANDRLNIKPIENKVARALNLGLIYKDISICSEVISPAQIKTENDTVGGLSFWATGSENNYYAVIYPDGSYLIGRRVDGNIVNVVPKTSADTINKGPSARNRLKLLLKGAVGTLYINDVKVREFRGQPPADGSSFGLYAESETDRRTEWSFTGIVVTEP